MNPFEPMDPEEMKMHFQLAADRVNNITWKQRLEMYLITFLLVHASIVAVINIIGWIK